MIRCVCVCMCGACVHCDLCRQGVCALVDSVFLQPT